MSLEPIIALSLALTSISATPSSTSDLRAADKHWNKVFDAQNLNASVMACAPDGAVLAPNAPRANGRDEIRKLFAGFFSLPKLHVTWNPSVAKISRSGDMGYTSGSYHMTFNDPSGKEVVDNGKYSTVWVKRNGKWLVELDCFNTDMPASGG